MSGSIFCDALNAILDFMQLVIDLGYSFVSLIGIQAPDLRGLLGIGSFLGCNI